MPTLKELVDQKKFLEGLSYEKMARIADISRNQFTNVTEQGFTDRTSLKTVRGFAKVLGMKPWELMRVLESGQ